MTLPQSPELPAPSGNAAGIANLLQPGGAHAGMGMIVDPNHVMTCAHVVNVALGRAMGETKPPPEGSRVALAFPQLPDLKPASGTVIVWRAPGTAVDDDVAVVRLDEPAPLRAGLARLADISGVSVFGDRLSVYGIAAGETFGSHVEARFSGQTSPWFQVDATIQKGAFIRPGYSGGGVWNVDRAVTVGMMVRKGGSPDNAVAYMIPAAALKAAWPPLPIERHPLSPSFNRYWTALAGFFFLFLLTQHSANRGVTLFEAIALGGRNKQLNAFWGMHAFAFLAPAVLFTMITFARSYRLHPWWQRLPSFGGTGPIPTATRLPRTAAATLVVFVLLPLAAQVHFLRMFHDEGSVYIYPGDFGFTAEELRATGQTCFTESIHLCTHPEAGRYHLVTPKPGFSGGYWNNAYHYGERSVDGGSVTFFPILQPVIVELLSLLALALAGLLMWEVFRSPSGEAAGGSGKGKKSAG